MFIKYIKNINFCNFLQQQKHTTHIHIPYTSHILPFPLVASSCHQQACQRYHSQCKTHVDTEKLCALKLWHKTFWDLRFLVVLFLNNHSRIITLIKFANVRWVDRVRTKLVLGAMFWGRGSWWSALRFVKVTPQILPIFLCQKFG